jgi:hypothetical protein
MCQEFLTFKVPRLPRLTTTNPSSGNIARVIAAIFIHTYINNAKDFHNIFKKLAISFFRGKSGNIAEMDDPEIDDWTYFVYAESRHRIVLLVNDLDRMVDPEIRRKTFVKFRSTNTK